MARVLVAFECSGTVREAFRALGHDAWSCDLKPATGSQTWHIQADVRDVMAGHIPRGSVIESAFRDTPALRRWDLMIAHPPCQFLSVSGIHWNTRRPERAASTEQALALVRDVMAAPIPRIAIENPVGLIGSRIRPADQWIQPYEFGDDASKKTGLWLKDLPRLAVIPSHRVAGRQVLTHRGTVERWANQTDSGQNRLGPSPGRAAARAVTYPGIAAAMAAAWG